MEQMLQIIRFVWIQRDSVENKEAFIDFIPFEVKTAEVIRAEITKKLDQDGLNLEDCTDKSYDNQATMASVHYRVQKRILVLNPFAVFVPCNNHSLSLVGVHAAQVNVQALILLALWNICFATVSCSTHRWSVLKDFINITVKSHSDTRWSSKAAAVNAI
jgi:hypothetical protein